MAKKKGNGKRANEIKGNKNHLEHKMKKSRNVWKVLAIVFVALFIIIMVAGILRSHRFREPPVQLTQTQINTAQGIALNDMNSKGDLIANYTIKTSGVARMIEADNVNKNITEVTIYNATARNMYIIDLDTGKILLYTRTEFFDGLNHLNDNMNRNPPQSPPREGGFLRR
jgi:hypothetical protein